MEPELKPCPFCGGPAELDECKIHDNHKIVDFFEIYCTNPDCFVFVTIDGYDKELVVQNWNKRVNHG